MTNSLLKLSNTRLPADNFLSGALLGFMVDFAQKKDAKEATKFALKTGLATAVSIKVANDIAEKKYLEGALSLVLGAGSVLLINEISKEK